MARIKTINRYPLAAYAQLFEEAREVANQNKIFSIPCDTYKEAQTRRFELYGFMRALSRSSTVEHVMRVKEYQSFKLVLFRTGFADQTLLQFQAYDNTKFALDIMEQVQASRAQRNAEPAIEPNTQTPTTNPEPAYELDTSGQAQMEVFKRLGYGAPTKK